MSYDPNEIYAQIGAIGEDYVAATFTKCGYKVTRQPFATSDYGASTVDMQIEKDGKVGFVEVKTKAKSFLWREHFPVYTIETWKINRLLELQENTKTAITLIIVDADRKAVYQSSLSALHEKCFCQDFEFPVRNFKQSNGVYNYYHVDQFKKMCHVPDFYINALEERYAKIEAQDSNEDTSAVTDEACEKIAEKVASTDEEETGNVANVSSDSNEVIDTEAPNAPIFNAGTFNLPCGQNLNVYQRRSDGRFFVMRANVFQCCGYANATKDKNNPLVQGEDAVKVRHYTFGKLKPFKVFGTIPPIFYELADVKEVLINTWSYFDKARKNTTKYERACKIDDLVFALVDVVYPKFYGTESLSQKVMRVKEKPRLTATKSNEIIKQLAEFVGWTPDKCQRWLEDLSVVASAFAQFR